MSPCIEVRTHCRLHFGLTSLGHDATRPQFGGVGLMVDGMGIVLRIVSQQEFGVSGPLSDRVLRYATSIAKRWQLPALPDVGIEVVATPREHIGLGTGSQLGLAIAAGLSEALGFSWRDPLRLARLTGRGRRSAVGTYGFLLGGMIVDGGHRDAEPLGRLTHRSDFPADWRFVLVIPNTQSGCAGTVEERAFAELPPVPRAVTTELEQIAVAELAPASERSDFSMFSNALYRYGCLAGQCFAAVQGGTYCSPQTAGIIKWLRERGVTGVGQSSWGPTVFALAPCQAVAEKLALEFESARIGTDCETLIAPAANTGACVRVSEVVA